MKYTSQDNLLHLLQKFKTTFAKQIHMHSINDIEDYEAPVQSDFAQNDSAAKDYIKNRTHWTEPGWVDLLPLQTVKLTLPFDGGGTINEIAVLSKPLNLVAGKEYVVNWNGVAYNCIAFDASENTNGLMKCAICAMKDNGAIRNVFEIADVSAEGSSAIGGAVYIHAYDAAAVSAGEITISIQQEGEVVHHLDPKFIKDMYYAEDDSNIWLDTIFSYSEDSDDYVTESSFVLTDGSVYKVVIDGTTYESVATQVTEDGLDLYCLGDIYTLTQGMFGSPQNVGQPFIIMSCPSLNLTQLLMESGDAEKNVSLSKIGTVHTIPPKYIKDMYYSESDTDGARTQILAATQLSEELFTLPLNLVEGYTYIVNWNAAEYACVAETLIEDGTIIGIGMGNIYGDPASAIPFVICEFTPEVSAQFGVKVIYMPTDSSNLEDNTVSIVSKGAAEIVHQIPIKYLPMGWVPSVTEGLIEYFPEYNLNFISNYAHVTNFNPSCPVEGQTYQVFWDGTIYECVATKKGDYLYYIGNCNIDTSDAPDTGEPFVFLWYGIAGTMFSATIKNKASGPNNITFKIMTSGGVTNRIPKEYMPKSFFMPHDLSGEVVKDDLIAAETTLNNDGKVYAFMGGAKYNVIWVKVDHIDGNHEIVIFNSDNIFLGRTGMGGKHFNLQSTVNAKTVELDLSSFGLSTITQTKQSLSNVIEPESDYSFGTFLDSLKLDAKIILKFKATYSTNEVSYSDGTFEVQANLSKVKFNTANGSSSASQGMLSAMLPGGALLEIKADGFNVEAQIKTFALS